ncbi:Ras guanine nucleotide exchange factor F [Diplonema papillatum]|nr:Ras guanine nucleotide exchange factor F [Diplonema papillatum]
MAMETVNPLAAELPAVALSPAAASDGGPVLTVDGFSPSPVGIASNKVRSPSRTPRRTREEDLFLQIRGKSPGDDDDEDFVPEEGTVYLFSQKVISSSSARSPRRSASPARKVKPLRITPRPRFGHTAVVHNNQMVLFGGRDDRCFDDLWTFCFATRAWREIPQTHQKPIPRAGHTAVVYRHKMYIFGGVADDAGVHNWWPDDLWALDLNTWQWTRIPSLGSLRPESRKGHTAVVYKDSMFVFGGGQDDPLLLHNDLWELDFSSERWIPRDYSGSIPAPRMYHVSALGDCGNLLIFGGRGSVQPSDAAFLNDTYTLNLDSMVARKLGTAGTHPSPRMCSTAVYHSGMLAIFTGGARTYLEDSHQLDLATLRWTPLCPSIKFGGRTRPTTVKWKNTILTFGGCVTGNGYVNDVVEIEMEPMSLKQHMMHYLATSGAAAIGELHLPSTLASRMRKRLKMLH